jgi:hypothetical protein
MIEKRNRKEEDEQQQQNEHDRAYKESPLFQHYSIWHIYNQSLTTNTNNILNI